MARWFCDTETAEEYAERGYQAEANDAEADEDVSRYGVVDHGAVKTRMQPRLIVKVDVRIIGIFIRVV